MGDVRDYTLVAKNTATTSANKIHDDEVAQRYGFRGGLVPGVDVYAYLTHPLAEAWGIDWLTRGTVRARFLSPVYEGDTVTVVCAANGPTVDIEVRNSAGEVCASGEAGLPDETPERPPPPTTEPTTAVASPPPASPESLASGTVLGLDAHTFRADRAGEYLADIGEDLPLYRAAGIAHPGWLLRDANYVLSANVVLGPWIHVESVVQHHSVVHDGEPVSAHATVTAEWERKGHRFVELDVGLFAAGVRPIAQVTHTAIYQPRAV